MSKEVLETKLSIIKELELRKLQDSLKEIYKNIKFKVRSRRGELHGEPQGKVKKKEEKQRRDNKLKEERERKGKELKDKERRDKERKEAGKYKKNEERNEEKKDDLSDCAKRPGKRIISSASKNIIGSQKIQPSISLAKLKSVVFKQENQIYSEILSADYANEILDKLKKDVISRQKLDLETALCHQNRIASEQFN